MVRINENRGFLQTNPLEFLQVLVQCGPFQLHVGRYLVLKIGKISQKSLVNTYMLITHVQLWGNVGKTIINHPQFHHFYRCYVYHFRSWVVNMTLFFPH